MVPLLFLPGSLDVLYDRRNSLLVCFFSQHLTVSVPQIGSFFQDWVNCVGFLYTVLTIMKSEGNDTAITLVIKTEFGKLMRWLG